MYTFIRHKCRQNVANHIYVAEHIKIENGVLIVRCFCIYMPLCQTNESEKQHAKSLKSFISVVFVLLR